MIFLTTISIPQNNNIYIIQKFIKRVMSHSRFVQDISALVDRNTAVTANAIKERLVEEMKSIKEWPHIRVIYRGESIGNESGIELWGDNERYERQRILRQSLPSLILLPDGLYEFRHREVPRTGFLTNAASEYRLDWLTKEEKYQHYIDHGAWAADRIEAVQRGFLYRG